MIDINNFFNKCKDVGKVDEKHIKLLDKIMSLASPVQFDDEFASEEELNELEAELDRLNIRSRQSDVLIRAINLTTPNKSGKFGFI